MEYRLIGPGDLAEERNPLFIADERRISLSLIRPPTPKRNRQLGFAAASAAGAIAGAAAPGTTAFCPPPNRCRRSSRRNSCSTLKPEMAPSWPVRVAVPSSDCARPNGLAPEATSETLRLPRPDSLVMPNNSDAQDCRSTSVNWNWALTSATASERATANEPLAMPPYTC